MKQMLALIAASAICFWGPRSAVADGCMFSKVTAATQLVSSPRQEALLMTDGRDVQVALRTHFRQGPKELAWIVPVPAKPEKIDKADDRVFRALEEYTAPEFRFSRAESGHLGCGCSGNFAMDKSTGLAEPSVVVESAGQAGVFDYTVLAATDSKDLAKWLADNEYRMPVGAERVFDPYVKDKWHWLCMKVRAEEASKPTLAPHPITYTYRSEMLVYPMIISQLSADVENEIVLYVLGRGRYTCANWANAEVDHKQVHAAIGSHSGTNYEELIRTMTTSNSGRLFVTEYYTGWGFGTEMGQLLTPGFEPFGGGKVNALTRLRAIMTPKAMDRDVVLVPFASDGYVNHIFDIASAQPVRNAAATVAVGIALIPCLCVSLYLTRRSRWGIVAGGLLIAMCCLAFTMM